MNRELEVKLLAAGAEKVELSPYGDEVLITVPVDKADQVRSVLEAEYTGGLPIHIAASRCPRCLACPRWADGSCAHCDGYTTGACSGCDHITVLRSSGPHAGLCVANVCKHENAQDAQRDAQAGRAQEGGGRGTGIARDE